MSNNLHRVQNIFISNGNALPANDAAITAVTDGQIGIFGRDMKALNPAGGDTITTQPSIYIVQGKTDTDGTFYCKRSMKIDGTSVLRYEGKSYEAPKREVWAIGYNRKTATGTIEVNNSTDYQFSIVLKNNKHLYSERQQTFRVNFTSSSTATGLSIATQITNAINNSTYSSDIIAVTVGNNTGAYGLTGATEWGVEITAKDVNQYLSTTYTLNQVYFQVAVNDNSGFGDSTTCTQIQAFDPGNGTYNQVYTAENFDFQYEGVINRTTWPIPTLDYSATSALISSAAIGINTTGTAGQDTLTYASTIAAILKPGDKITISGNAYEVKYIKGNGTGVGAANAVVLTSVLLTSPAAADVTIVKVKYDLVTIEFNDAINGPTGNIAVANKSVVIAVPALDAGDAYNGVSAAGQDVMDILNAWMTTTPAAFDNISI